MSDQALNGVKKSLLCELVEHLATQKNARARLLFAGCLLSGSFNAAATTYIVNTTGDPGPSGTTSFRQAVATASASPGNVIQFDDSLRNSTITLTQGAVMMTPSTGSTLTILGPGSRQLTISGNGTSRLINQEQNLTISGLTLTNGRANGGGCLAAILTNLFLVDVVITGCISDGTLGTGGGLDMGIGNVTIFNSTITGNYASGNGGGIYVAGEQGVKVAIYDSTISNNTTYGFGGGIYVGHTTTFNVTGSLISGNNTPLFPSATVGGGGIALASIYSQALIVNSTIANNTTYTYGGGIDLLDTHTAQVTQINFSTLTGNYSGYNYGGNAIHAKDAFSVSSSIIANNLNRNSNVDVDGTVFADHSLFRNIGGAKIIGSNNIFGSDPKLGPMAFNGGATLTFLPKVGSPVIDAGGSTGTIHNDERNRPRPVGAASDIGAVERQVIEDEIFRSDFESS
jgi:hypothetical protein